ncbi:sigma-70 family RNA polymerase sigma factor [bacterium]|nr:sigma-70 family RNA polymerase sigma factor [bacterium]
MAHTKNSYNPNISLLKSGDNAEFMRFVASFKDRVFNTCLSFVPNQADAEDLAQEVFVEVFQSVKHFNEQAMLSTWVYRIAVNKCLEELRRRKQQKRAAFFKGLLGIDHEALQAQSSDFDHPGFVAENNELAQAIFGEMNKLPESQRIAFTLTQIDGMSYEETAAVMGNSKSSVESLIFRARTALKKNLKPLKP